MPPKKSAATKRAREDSTSETTPVILDHDGGVDDLVAMALLLARPDRVRMIGCIVTDADCYVKDGYSCSGKLAALIQRKSGGKRIHPFPIAKSSLPGVNPFPHEWRVDAKKMDDLPVLNVPKYCDNWEKAFGTTQSGEELMASLVMGSPQPVTLCVTGPLTNVAHCITKHGAAFTDHVKEVVIMGGAVDVEGNVFEPNRDRSAEWNIYWDAPAAKTVLESDLLAGKVVLFSLDATNHVPVTSSIVQQFGAYYPHALANFIGSSWAQCTHLDTGSYGIGYFAWDVLTAAFVIDRTVAKLDPVPIVVDAVPQSPNEGRTRRDAQHGATILVAHSVDDKKFYQMVLEACSFV